MRRAGDFRRAYAEGSRARGDALMVVLCGNGGEATRLGLSVGRKVWKSAVRRNRVRRILREAFRLEYAQLPGGCDLILVPARPRLEPELGAIRRELVALARRAHERWVARRAPSTTPAEAPAEPLAEPSDGAR